jgi:hypothetical protein
MNTSYTVKQAANQLHITPQAIHYAISKKKIDAKRIDGKWSIEQIELVNYLKNKWSRRNLTHHGLLVYDPKNGLISPRELSKQLDISLQAVYYHIYQKSLPAQQKGAAWVIDLKQAKKYFGV